MTAQDNARFFGRFFLLLPRFDAEGHAEAVYLLPDANGWSLPAVTAAADDWLPVREVRQAAHDDLGIDATVLLWPARDPAPGADERHYVVVLEPHALEFAHGGEWVPPEGWERLHFARPEHEPPVHRWLAAARTGEAPAQRVPWARPGWFAAATAWIGRALADAYLERWASVVSRAACRDALARPLAALHIAVSYGDIRRATEPDLRWQLAGALPFFLREVLKHRAGLATGK